MFYETIVVRLKDIPDRSFKNAELRDTDVEKTSSLGGMIIRQSNGDIVYYPLWQVTSVECSGMKK